MKFYHYDKSNLNSNPNINNLYKIKNFDKTQKKETHVRLRKREKEREARSEERRVGKEC